jgi:hypothetical protein
MKITVIGHASILIEAGGISILSDPWWRGPCFGSQWWNYPPARRELVEGRKLDYIYISHGHHDHLHAGTLRLLDKTAKVLVSRTIGIASTIRNLGFEVVEIDDADELRLGGDVECRIIRTYGDDTLMAVTDGDQVCVNLNDALHSAPEDVQARFISLLRSLYPQIDYVFCGYGVASHFPNCYEIPGKDRCLTAVKRQLHFSQQWARVIAGLSPRFGFPFAADVVFLEDALSWANEPTHNGERPTAVFRARYPNSDVATFDVAPGFAIQSGKIVNDSRRSPILNLTLQQEYSESIQRANRQGSVDEGDVRDVLHLIQQNLSYCLPHLATFPADYRFMVLFYNTPFGIEIVKRDTRINIAMVNATDAAADCDIVYRTRLPYLKLSLSVEFGDEILFVGSGGIFRYANAADARRNLHRELKVLLTKQASKLPPRERGRGSPIRWAKRKLLRLVGQESEDLYDLGRWTVFKG